MNHNILLIDDDRSFRDSMSLFLKDEGFNVRAVANGDEAIALARQQIIPFSIALVDYHSFLIQSNFAPSFFQPILSCRPYHPQK